MSTSRTTIAVLTGALTCLSASAAIITTDLGTAAPPATLGGYTMTAFGADPSPVFSDVSGVASPLGGTLSFTPDLSHRQVGNGWATWSHGYTGDVYYSNGATTVGLGLPAGTCAFIFYAEPNPFGVYDITATADDGTTQTLSIEGNSGAKGFGFHSTGGSVLTSITVTSQVDFAVGEFSIAACVPEPQAYAGLAALGLLGFGVYRRLQARR